MTAIDILVVRITPFVLFFILGINILCCWMGVESVNVFNELHGNSALYALALFLISLSNKKYHCSWNRAMYIFLIAVPVINFADALLDFIPNERDYLTALWTAYLLTSVLTAVMAIRHFLRSNIKSF